MLDDRSRVTVVGARKRLDVSLPSEAPVGEYVGRLAELCGQDRRRVLPQAWSLSVPGRVSIPLGESLAEQGVTDGEVLYLRDLARDLDAAPVVEDIDEAVAAEADRLRRKDLS